MHFKQGPFSSKVNVIKVENNYFQLFKKTKRKKLLFEIILLMIKTEKKPYIIFFLKYFNINVFNIKFEYIFNIKFEYINICLVIQKKKLCFGFFLFLFIFFL